MKKVLKIALGVLFLLLLIGTFVFLWNKTRPEKEVFAIDLNIDKIFCRNIIFRQNININLSNADPIDTLEKRAVATGKVEPRDEVLIKPQISGIISEIYKEAGELVQQGEVIAKVKVIPEMATLNSAESRVNVAKISLEQTQRDYDRVKELFDSGVISKEEFEQSETALSKAQEEMQNAKDNLEIVQNGIASRNAELSNTQIRSTITGMILDVPVKVGNSVIQSNTFNDGTTIATVADLNDMIFRGKVDETEVGRLKEQMPVKLTIGALQDISLDATLEYIAPKGTEENGVVMFEIKAAAQVPADIFIRAGYSANADIVIERREGVLTIPESSVTFEGDKTYVNLLTSDSTATEQTFERKEVTLGMSDGVNIEIKEGLSGDESLKGEKITAPR